MPFNTLPFMLLAAVALFTTLQLHRLHRLAPQLFLIAVSLGFYALWNPSDLPILLLSMAGNFAAAHVLARSPGRWKKIGIWVAVSANLAVLAWYKIDSGAEPALRHLLPWMPDVARQGLPLGISFFTFQQIAYLVRIGKGSAALGPADYSFVISFFPHLVAGPLVRHSDMIVQLRRPSTFRFRIANLFGGTSLFVIGLAKKVLLADPIGHFSHTLYAAVDAGASPGLMSSWMGAVSAMLNLYFDFSAYSDMACGMALVIGVRLPMNFYSPLRAVSMDDFWNRWNISITTFIRDHVFRPLAGSKMAIGRHLTALPLTMVLAGLWHGATLNFVTWGALHGALVSYDHARRLIWRAPSTRRGGTSRKLLGWARTHVTLLALGCIFSSSSLASASRMLAGMSGLNGTHEWAGNIPLVPLGSTVLALAWPFGWTSHEQATVQMVLVVTTGWLIAMFAPNSMQLLSRYRPALDTTRLLRRERRILPGWVLGLVSATWLWTLLISTLFALSVLCIAANAPSTFNYYHY